MSTVNPQQTAEAVELGLRSSASKLQKPTGSRLVHAINGSLVSAIVIFIAVLWSIPTFGLFISSFRPAQSIASSGWWSGLVPPWNFTLHNYQQVVQAQGLGLAFLNSLIIAIPGTVLPVLVAAFAAYAFAWMKFPGRDWLFLAMVALLVLPIQSALIPMLGLFTAFNLTGSYIAIWLAHTAFGLPFAVYLLRNFFAALPSDLFESAFIDGASNWKVFTSILLPLSVPSLASLVIFQFMWVWNDLLIALVILGGNPSQAPLTVTVANLVNSFGSNYEVLTSAAFISMLLPLLVFFSLQRYFVRGILAGSVKG